MRDYGNMPKLNWKDPQSAKKAMAQVHHAEPVILLMPDDFSFDVDVEACGCDAGNQPQHLLNCRAEDTLKTLADRNTMPELAELAAVAHEAGQVIDLQGDTHRIIIHD